MKSRAPPGQPSVSRRNLQPSLTAKQGQAGLKESASKGFSREDTRPVSTPEEKLLKAKNHAASQAMRPGVISKILFGISSAEEIKGYGRCKVSDPEVSEKPGCILDPQMGPHSTTGWCPKCDKSVWKCSGHPGYIEFSVYVYHPAFVKSLVKILSLFCFTHWKKSSQERAKFISDYVAAKNSSGRKTSALNDENEAINDPNCPKIDIRPCFNVLAAKTTWQRVYGESKLKLIDSTQCSGDNQAVKYKLGESYIEQEIGSKKDDMDPEEVRNFLAAIDSDVDSKGVNHNWAAVIGFGGNKLQSLVMPYFPVMSNIHRTSKMIKGSIEQNHFTIHYRDIVALNKEIQNAIARKRSEGKVQAASNFFMMKQAGGSDTYRALTASIHKLVFSTEDTSNKPFDTEKRSNMMVVSIDNSLKGKPGLLRKDILGKGSDYSGRTVLIGDTDIDVDEVGISKAFADGITIPEKISSEEDLQYWSQHMPKTVSGKKVVGWIKRVDKLDETIIDLETKNTTLEKGDVVRRSLVTGDILVITRQPVLHKGGLMGFKARVFEDGGNVIRINPAVTGPYNADFDGDEMNMAVPQELASRQETMRNMMVTNCVRGDQFSAPWIGLIQNAIIAGKQLTESGTILDVRQRNSIISRGEETYSKRNPGNVFRTSVSEFLQELDSLKANLKPTSGRAAISYFFPKGFSYERSPKGQDKIIVENGFLISGVLDKSDLGKSSGGMIDTILQQYGPEAVIVFLSAITRGLYEYIETVGFTLGAADCIILGEKDKKSPQDTIDSLILDMRTSVTKLLESTDRSGTLAKLAETEVDKQIAELGDRLNAIVRSGGIDIVAKKKALAAESNNTLLLDALTNVLSAEFTIDEYPKFFTQILKMETTTASFKKYLQNIIEAIRNNKRKNMLAEISIEIEVFKICTKVLSDMTEDSKIVLTSLQARMAASVKAVTNLMIKQLKNSISLRAEITGADKFDNNFLYIVASGAKGTAANFAQVLASVGPQQRELIDVNPVTGRSLPFSERWSLDPVANGFCASSYGKGLDPIEFWHHAQASRGNIIESNLKPKDTGYFYRRAWIMMGDILTYEDGSARNENGRVVQFSYGGDMFDPRSLINVKGEAQFVHVSMAVKIVRSGAGATEFEYESK
jgi:DNA-directed RNA polymerase beta' subunit